MTIDPKKAVQLAHNRAARYKATAHEAENLLEQKSRQLYELNNELEEAKNNLAQKVKEQTAELRRANQELKKASRHKSKFLANVSHELRTPLNAIIALSELLLQTDTSETQQDYLHTITSASDSLLYLINDILDFSKIEAGKMSLECQTFNPEDEFNQLIRLFEFQAIDKEISLELVCTSTLPRFIEADLNRIKQIAINLVSNAIKFTDHGGVRIRVDFQPGLSNQNQGQLSITIIDTGTGISQAKRASVFSAFEQASISEGGTGLGLTICQKLTDLMNGRIQCWSKIGLGSIFKATIPVKSASPPETTDKIQEHKSSQLKYNILIAEDNPVNQKVIRAQLNSLGHNTVIVDNGELALERLKNESFDLVFLDIQMPVLDGIKTLKAIKSSQKGTTIDTCIALTANAFKGERERLLKLGFDYYLSKPLTLNNLRECIQHFTSQGEKPEVKKPKPQETVDINFLESQFGNQTGSILAQLAPVFIEQTTLQINDLEQAIQKADSHTINVLSHSIKGAAASIGARKLSDLTNQIETSMGQDNLDGLLSQVQTEFSIVKAELHELLSTF